MERGRPDLAQQFIDQANELKAHLSQPYRIDTFAGDEYGTGGGTVLVTPGGNVPVEQNDQGEYLASIAGSGGDVTGAGTASTTGAAVKPQEIAKQEAEAKERPFGTGFGQALGFEYGLKNSEGDLFQKYDAQGNLTEYLDRAGKWQKTSDVKPVSTKFNPETGELDTVYSYKSELYGENPEIVGQYVPGMSKYHEDQGGFLGEGGWSRVAGLVAAGLTAGVASGAFAGIGIGGAGLVPGSAAAIGTAVAKGALTSIALAGLQGASPQEMLKAGLTGAVSAGISSYLPTAGFSSFEQAALRVGTQTGLAAVTGGDVKNALISSIISSSLSTVMNEALPKDTLDAINKLPPEAQKVLMSTLNSTLMAGVQGEDISDAAIRGVTNGLKSVATDFAKGAFKDFKDTDFAKSFSNTFGSSSTAGDFTGAYEDIAPGITAPPTNVADYTDPEAVNAALIAAMQNPVAPGPASEGLASGPVTSDVDPVAPESEQQRALRMYNEVMEELGRPTAESVNDPNFLAALNRVTSPTGTSTGGTGSIYDDLEDPGGVQDIINPNTGAGTSTGGTGGTGTGSIYDNLEDPGGLYDAINPNNGAVEKSPFGTEVPQVGPDGKVIRAFEPREMESLLQQLGRGTVSMLDNTVGAVIPAVTQMASYLGLRTADQVAELMSSMLGSDYTANPDAMLALSQQIAASVSQPFAKAVNSIDYLTTGSTSDIRDTAGYDQEASGRFLRFVDQNIDDVAKYVSEAADIPKGDVRFMIDLVAANPRGGIQNIKELSTQAKEAWSGYKDAADGVISENPSSAYNVGAKIADLTKPVDTSLLKGPDYIRRSDSDIFDVGPLSKLEYDPAIKRSEVVDLWNDAFEQADKIPTYDVGPAKTTLDNVARDAEIQASFKDVFGTEPTQAQMAEYRKSNTPTNDFKDYFQTKENTEISQAYKDILGVEPDAAGLKYWADTGDSINKIRNDIQVDANKKAAQEYKRIFGVDIASDNSWLVNSTKGVAVADVAQGWQNWENQEIAKIYNEAFGREPDAAGLKYWADSGQDLSAIRNNIQLNKNDEITKAYKDILGREPDAAGLKYWAESGNSIEDIRKNITTIKKQETDKVAADKKAADDKVAADKIAADKAIADKAAADAKAVADAKIASDKAAADAQAAADKAAADKVAAENATADKAAAAYALAEKSAADARLAADKAAEAKAALDKATSDKVIADNQAATNKLVSDVNAKIAENEKAGLTRSEATDKAIKDLAESTGKSDNEIKKLVTDNQAAATKLVSDLDAKVAANEAAGMTRDQATQKAISDLAASTGKSDTEIKALIASNQSDTAKLVSGLDAKIAANEAAGMTRDAATDKAIKDLAGQLGTTEASLLSTIGKTKTELVKEIGTQISASESKLQAQIAANEKAGMTRDAATDAAIKTVSAQLGTTEQSLLSSIGKTKTELVAEIGTQISASESRLKDQIAKNEAAGMTRDQATDAAIKTVSTQLGLTEQSLLTSIGKTKADLAGQISNVQSTLADQIAKNEAAGLTRSEASDKAIKDLAASLGTTEQALRDSIAASQSGLEQTIGGVKTELTGNIAGVKSDLTKLITANEVAGLTRSEASDKAIKDLAESLGTTEKALLAAIGASQSGLESLIGGVKTDLGTAIGGVKTDLAANIADTKTALLDQIAKNEAAGMTRDNATQAAITGISRQLGVTEANLLSTIGQTKTELSTKITDVRDALTGQIVGVKDDLTGQIGNVKTDLGGQITGLGKDLSGQIGGVGQQVTDLTSSFTQAEKDRVDAANKAAAAKQKQENVQEFSNIINSRATGEVKSAPLAAIDYLYDISGDSVFATPKQESLFLSPFEKAPDPVEGAMPKYQYADGGLIGSDDLQTIDDLYEMLRSK
jgi:hypothetical protein